MVAVSRRLLAIVLTVLVVTASCAGGDADLDDAALEPSPTVEAAGERVATPTAAPTPPPEASATAAEPESTTVPADPSPLPEPTSVDVDPTPAPETSPTPAATAEPAAGDPCSSGLAGDASLSATARADLDGDGAGDQVTTYRVGEGDNATWHIRVDTAAGESLDSPLTEATTADATVQPLGGADVDGDGFTDELFTVVGSGASVLIVAIHQRVGCELVQVTSAGAPIGFPIGGGVANIGGLECLDTDQNGVNNTIVAWSGLADFDEADGTYRMDGVEYELRGTELRELGSRQLIANVSEADFVYGQLTCDTVSL